MWLLGQFLLGGHRFAPDCDIWGDVPMMDRFLPRHGLIWRATRFYPAVTPAKFSCGGIMVSGRKSVCAVAGAR
ncbi:hypothetical protein Hanom_Chr08g00717221 [Helianthus anomalus]